MRVAAHAAWISASGPADARRGGLCPRLDESAGKRCSTRIRHAPNPEERCHESRETAATPVGDGEHTTKQQPTVHDARGRSERHVRRASRPCRRRRPRAHGASANRTQPQPATRQQPPAQQGRCAHRHLQHITIHRYWANVGIAIQWPIERAELGRNRNEPGDGFRYVFRSGTGGTGGRAEWFEVTEVFEGVEAKDIEAFMRLENGGEGYPDFDPQRFLRGLNLGMPRRAAQRRAADKVIAAGERKLAKSSYEGLWRPHGYGTLIVDLPLWFATYPLDPLRVENVSTTNSPSRTGRASGRGSSCTRSSESSRCCVSCGRTGSAVSNAGSSPGCLRAAGSRIGRCGGAETGSIGSADGDSGLPRRPAPVRDLMRGERPAARIAAAGDRRRRRPPRPAAAATRDGSSRMYWGPLTRGTEEPGFIRSPSVNSRGWHRAS